MSNECEKRVAEAITALARLDFLTIASASDAQRCVLKDFCELALTDIASGEKCQMIEQKGQSAIA